jgi:uncharacterized protein YyaL (SSP411 family)
LLQHAHNPVDWYAWGPVAFEKARKREKADLPVYRLLDLPLVPRDGARSRSRSEQIAAILNKYFVPIKVDREERPDVDRIYMAYVQATTGGGGCAYVGMAHAGLEAFRGGNLFSAGEPLWARRIPDAARAHRPIMAYRSRENSAIQPRGAGALAAGDGGGAFSTLAPSALESGFLQFRRSFDSKLGGFGQAPKLPRRPVTHNFRPCGFYAAYAPGGGVVDMVLANSLRAMAKWRDRHDQFGRRISSLLR